MPPIPFLYPPPPSPPRENFRNTLVFLCFQGLYEEVNAMKLVDYFSSLTLHQKWSFSLRISSVNMAKSAVSCGFCHSYWRNPWWKTSFFLQCLNEYRWNPCIWEGCPALKLLLYLTPNEQNEHQSKVRR